VVLDLRVAHEVAGQVLAYLVALAHHADRLRQALARIAVDRDYRGRDEIWLSSDIADWIYRLPQ
jgi:hypothetical protein